MKSDAVGNNNADSCQNPVKENGMNQNSTYQIPNTISNQMSEKAASNVKKIMHALICLLMFLALFQPFVAMNSWETIKNVKDYGASSSEIRDLKKNICKANKELTAVNLCGKGELDVIFLIVFSFFMLIISVLCALLAKSSFVPTVIFKLLGSVPITAYIILRIIDALSRANVHYSIGFYMMIVSWILLIVIGFAKKGNARKSDEKDLIF